jgi:hypothetical protein
VDILGQIRLYHGHPQVIVRDSRQVKGEAAKLPPIPENHDVLKHGIHSPGQRPTHKDKTPKPKHLRRGAETIPTEQHDGGFGDSGNHPISRSPDIPIPRLSA